MAEETNKEENKRIINEKDREQLKKHFQALKDPVTMVFFTQEFECQFCRETRQILTEVSELSNKVNLTVYDFQKDAEKASQYTIDKIPATLILGTQKDYGIRFFGMPSGYEFTALILAITRVSQKASHLTPETIEKIASLNTPVHIQVFTTPTCPFCPQAVQTAHQFAIQSDFITADMVESVEFPHLAQKYEVFSVPKTVINETHTFVGALPEEKIADEIMNTIQQ